MPTNTQAQEFLQTLSPFAFAGKKQQALKAENEKSERVVSGLGAQLVNKVRIIDTNITRVAAALSRVVTALSGQLDRKSAYTAQEAQMEAIRQQAQTQNASVVRESTPDVAGELKSLFRNPVFIAGIAGAIYALLPDQNVIKRRIQIFVGELAQQFGIANKELSDLHPAIKAAGIALATYFTVPLITSLASALANVIRLSKFVGTILLPKGAGNVARTVVGAAVLGAATVAGGKAIKDAVTGSKSDSGENAGSAGAKSSAPGAQKTAGPTVAASSESVDIKKYVKFNSSVDLDGLDPSFKDKFAAMAKEYEERTGRKLQVNSAYRSTEKQAALYKKLGPGKASRPGTSLHEKGLAIDIQSFDANKLAGMGLLDKYGFRRPYNAEPWHIEPAKGSVGAPDNPDRPGASVPTVGKGEEAVDIQSGKPVGTPKGAKLESAPAPSSIQPPMETGGEVIDDSLQSLPSASLEPSTVGRGDQIAMLSTKVEGMYTAAPSNNVIPINNSQTGAINLEQQRDDPPPVPNPIADRGSLRVNTTHSTAYG